MRNLTPSEIECKGSPERGPLHRDSSDRKTQRARLLNVLVEAHGEWVPLPEILSLGIAQFGARILELRRTGFKIENRTERDDAGAIHSWYRLVSGLASLPTKPENSKPATDSADWFTSASGRPRPSVTAESLFLWERGQ